MTVSSGPKHVGVPDLRGQDLPTAKANLEQAGLQGREHQPHVVDEPAVRDDHQHRPTRRHAAARGLRGQSALLERHCRRCRCPTSSARRPTRPRRTSRRQAWCRARRRRSQSTDPAQDGAGAEDLARPPGKQVAPGLAGDHPGRQLHAADRRTRRRPTRRRQTRPSRPRRPRERPAARRRARRWALVRARDLVRVGPVGRGRARSRALRGAAGRDRRGRLLAAARQHRRARRSRRELVDASGGAPARAPPRSRRRSTAGPRRSPGSTWCSPRCTGRSARTARCRACSRRSGSPYVGSGVLGSSVAMDKDLCKNVLRGARASSSRHR